ncbi:MAG: helix-turn-helix domain-containing protein [Alphaproteobacteria bacterium]|nr:helix-turn-helix domain-containing protein [Alphaproteobacteria bacterium]MCW5740885.1 helix-turn-helix domain-containing protein [Alphaproteobacteria bacterium]
MREPFRELGHRIKGLRKQKGLTQQEFAARLGVTQPTVHRWEKGAFTPDDKMLEVLSDMAGVPTAVFRYGEIRVGRRMSPVAGHVGAGGEVLMIGDPSPGAGTEEVEAPPDSGLSMVALKVRGDALLPAYADGDILFYGRDPGLGGVDPATCVGRECVVKLVNGPTLVKRLAVGGGRNTYLLMSFVAEPIVNVRLEWASPVRWVKRR